MSEPVILVCVRAADAETVPSGARFDRKCAVCESAVALAPSSQRFLKLNPAARIECIECHQPEPDDVGEFIAPANELIAEVTNLMPNPYRRRN